MLDFDGAKLPNGAIQKLICTEALTKGFFKLGPRHAIGLFHIKEPIGGCACEG
jgi:hypothetical protein